MNENGDNQKLKNLENQSTQYLIDKKIAEAKLAIVEKRLSYYLAVGAAFLTLFGTIFGIFYPIFSSLRSENKVDKAIEQMESKFRELAGKQLRRPEMTCYMDGRNLLNNAVQFDPDNRKPRSIEIKNIGNGTAEYVKMCLYVSSENDQFRKSVHFPEFGMRSVNDKPEYKWSYRYYGEYNSAALPAHDSFSIGIYPSNLPIFESDITATALLRIFYGEPNPQDVPFEIQIMGNKK